MSAAARAEGRTRQVPFWRESTPGKRDHRETQVSHAQHRAGTAHRWRVEILRKVRSDAWVLAALSSC